MDVGFNVKSTLQLKEAVRLLLDDLVTHAFNDAILNFDKIAESVHDAEYLSKQFDSFLNHLINFENQCRFISDLYKLNFDFVSQTDLKPFIKEMTDIKFLVQEDTILENGAENTEIFSSMEKFSLKVNALKASFKENPLLKQFLLDENGNNLNQYVYGQDSFTEKKLLSKLNDMIPCQKVLEDLLKSKSHKLELAFALFSNGIYLVFSKEGEIKRYSLSHTRDDSHSRLYFQLFFQGEVLQFNYLNRVVPSGLEPHKFAKSAQAIELARSVLKNDIQSKFPSTADLRIPEIIDDYKKLKQELSKFILHTVAADGSIIFYDFICRKFYYVADPKKFANRNEIRITDTSFPCDAEGNKLSQIVSVYSPVSSTFEYAGCLENEPFSFDIVAQNLKNTLTNTVSVVTTMTLPLLANLKFYKSSLSILCHLQRMMIKINSAFPQLRFTQEDKELFKNFDIIEVILNDLSHKINSKTKIVEMKKNMEKTIFNKLNLTINYFRKITQTPIYSKFFQDFEESHLDFRGKVYPVSMSGIITLLTENIVEDSFNENMQMIYTRKGAFLSEENLCLKIIGKSLQLSFSLRGKDEQIKSGSKVLNHADVLSHEFFLEFCSN